MREQNTAGIYEARNQLHQYYRCPTMVDGADIEDAEFFLDVMSDLNRYISGSEIGQEPSYTVTSGRSHPKYSLDTVEEIIEEERAHAEPRHAIHLLSALDKLNRYRAREHPPVTVPEEVRTEPVDEKYLEPR